MSEIDNEEMKRRVEKAFKILGTSRPTMEQYAEYLGLTTT